ncbi:MAG: hypothetical protein IPJ18_20220 [Betaproteobacteria bacterium]|nr:hypothetical protein [Betaproteobacteria bacterium]
MFKTTKGLAKSILKEVVAKHTVSDQGLIQTYVQSHYAELVGDQKPNISLGLFAEKLLALVQQHVARAIQTSAARSGHKPTVIGLPADNGALLTTASQVGTPVAKRIAVVFNSDHARQCQELGFERVVQCQHLGDVNRTQLGIADDEHLVLVMNPKANDPTSMYGRREKTAEQAAAEAAGVVAPALAETLQSKDMARRFIKAAMALKADAIVMVLPMSQVAKRANFRDLKDFWTDYQLDKGAIVSSQVVGTGKTGKPFPVLIGTFVPGSMSFDDMRQFEFEIHRKVGDKLVHNGEFLQLAKAQPLVAALKGTTRAKEPRPHPH